MDNLKIFCITNKQSSFLEKLNLDLVGVGRDDFTSIYLNTKRGNNIQDKESYYSELTFHYWLWKNDLKNYDENDWIGFCQKRRFWLQNGQQKINNFNDLNNHILKSVPKEWLQIDSIICSPIKVNQVRKMKMLKRGWKNLIKDPSIFINQKKQNLKLQFDMYHGYDVLSKAINVMDTNDRSDFFHYVNTKNEFNPNIMCISKKIILNKWFESVFAWLSECEKVFGFEKLTGYDQSRLYAFLAERYHSFWFKKYTKYLPWHWAFFDINKL
jgi:hypothetical protein